MNSSWLHVKSNTFPVLWNCRWLSNGHSQGRAWEMSVRCWDDRLLLSQESWELKIRVSHLCSKCLTHRAPSTQLLSNIDHVILCKAAPPDFAPPDFNPDVLGCFHNTAHPEVCLSKSRSFSLFAIIFWYFSFPQLPDHSLATGNEGKEKEHLEDVS